MLEEPPPLNPRALARVDDGDAATVPVGIRTASAALGLACSRSRPNRLQPLEE
jgi:hypothetical protein